MSENATTKKVVNTLPELNQAEYPQLPQLDDEKAALLVFGSPLRNAEKEWALAILATAAIRAKKWVAVNTDTIFDIAPQVCPPWGMQGMVNASWELAKDGMIEIITFEDRDYLVPMPAFASMIATSDLRRSK